MQTENIFKEKTIKILFIIFLILTIVSIIYASITQRGILFDGTLYFIKLLNSFPQDNWTFSLIASRPRLSIFILSQIPINIAYNILGINSKYWLGVAFSLPLFLFPALITYFNYILARRSKRYDIFVISLMIFSLFIIHTNIYSIVELLIAIPILFLLFHYTIAEIDYKWYDLLTIVFLLIVSYYSYEIVIFTSIIQLFAAIFYAKKTNNIKNKLTKYFIAVNSIFMPLIYINFYRIMPPDFLDKSRCEMELDGILNYFIDSTTMIDYTFIVFCLLIVLFFNKKFFSKIQQIIIISIFTILFIYLADKYAYSYTFFIKRIILFGIFPIIMLFSLLLDMFKINELKYINILKNTTFVILLIGIINILFSIQFSYLFNDSVNKLNKIVYENPNNFISPSKDVNGFLYEPFSKICFSSDTYTITSIIFNQEYKIEKIIIPDKTDPNCPTEFYFEGNMLKLPYAADIDIKNKFWDISSLKTELENNPTLKEEIINTIDTTSPEVKVLDYIFN